MDFVTLSPSDPKYQGHYTGDSSYHNGCVWPWLTGCYVEARIRNGLPREKAALILAPVLRHIREAGMGYISEIFDGNSPHRRGDASRRRGAWQKFPGRTGWFLHTLKIPTY